MNPTIYLHPQPTDSPEAHFLDDVSVSLELSPSIKILGGFDEETAVYMYRLAAAARRLAQAVQECSAAQRAYEVTI